MMRVIPERQRREGFIALLLWVVQLWLVLGTSLVKTLIGPMNEFCPLVAAGALAVLICAPIGFGTVAVWKGDAVGKLYGATALCITVGFLWIVTRGSVT
jgi:hypothetical protein